jgi:excisionase family DNA binding protein
MEQQNSNQLPEMLSTDDLAKIFRISKVSTYRLVEQRRIPFYKIGGSLRFAKDDVMKFLNDNKFEARGGDRQ